MKIIHCADLHLDSRLNTHLDEKRAKERRQELLGTWLRLLEYASKQQVSAILISGDMFDTAAVSGTTANAVIGSIRNHPEIVFFYLKGNHDTDTFLNRAEALPENMYTFNDSWRMFRLSGNIVVSGRELSTSFAGAQLPENWAARTLKLKEEDFNIVMLHGQVITGYSTEKPAETDEDIYISDYAEHNIDYMALGHIHKYSEGRIDGRGMWCYPGCLEGRGFDECSRHGFIMLDINEETHEVKRQMIDFSTRHLWLVPVDITGLETSIDIVNRTKAELSLLGGVPASSEEIKNLDSDAIKEILEESGGGRLKPEDMVRVILKGELDITAEKNMTFIRSQLDSMFYYTEVVDDTRRTVDYRIFENDRSLKGEFIRSVREDMEIGDELKAEIIECGIKLLIGS
ncbi:DNA repair exonuclease SbcCD nuclease subunit [Oribacterium sp. KHPX15]|uniref:metallophosphoesterase family protein n=1 Tax=Oribacterium sp. KHPX15 TaxID=1855342 RepID=UPI0008955A3D|nr:DNA repair exonuclease [Oribacterium sp. KHPX15]SEA12792.1 DNA repair exonuclease SbcCD nuclease subunit [Oribacterium sp. KHPX15]